MGNKLIFWVFTSASLLLAGIDPDDSLYVRTLLDADRLTDVKVGDVVNYDVVNGRVFSLYLSNVYTIYGKKLTRLPDDIDRLDTLLYLMVNDAALETLPEAIGKLSHLKIIEVQRNRLKTLPESIGDCPKLEYINVANNELRTLPAGIGRSTSLYSIDVSQNLLSSLPDEIAGQTFKENYAAVNFNGNYLCNLTGLAGEWFSTHFSTSQQNCSLDGTDVSVVRSILDEAGLNDVLPEMVASFQQGRVTRLDLSTRNLTVVPSGVGQLAMLEELILENNRLTDLPAGLADLESLLKINVSRNCMSRVPQVVLSCRKLETLYIEYNELTDLPLELMSVKCVTCRFNRLCALSETLDGWLEKMDGGVYRHDQNCPIPEEGHPMLSAGNAWRYTIIQQSATTEDTDSLVREIVIEGISPSRDTVFTRERDSGMVYDGNSGTFVPVDTAVNRDYQFAYQRLVPLDRNRTAVEDMPLLINSDWNSGDPLYRVDTFKVFAQEAYFYNEDSATAIKHLCISERIGLLGGELLSENGVLYQIYLSSFNGTVFDSENFRRQVGTVSRITALKNTNPYGKCAQKSLPVRSGTLKRFDLLGRKVIRTAAARTAPGCGIIIEKDNFTRRSVLRLIDK